MSEPTTLLSLAGADLNPPKLSDSCLVIIDMQNEYLDGPLKIPNAKQAIASAQNLLSKIRKANGKVIHIAHKGKEGSLFDRDTERGQIVDELTPLENEPLIEKSLPNSFAGTDLDEQLKELNMKEVIFVGFMSHMCVSSTARAALDLGYRSTIEETACGTRDLPNGKGGIIDAQAMHDAAMVGLSDRFAVIARGYDWQ